jgi:hypothetical protein
MAGNIPERSDAGQQAKNNPQNAPSLTAIYGAFLRDADESPLSFVTSLFTADVTSEKARRDRGAEAPIAGEDIIHVQTSNLSTKGFRRSCAVSSCKLTNSPAQPGALAAASPHKKSGTSSGAAPGWWERKQYSYTYCKAERNPCAVASSRKRSLEATMETIMKIPVFAASERVHKATYVSAGVGPA